MATGGIPRVAVEDPPAEVFMAVIGGYSTAHVAHGVYLPGTGMDGYVPNSKGCH